MSASRIDFAVERGKANESDTDPVRRTAFYINGDDGPFFGWLHQPAKKRCSNHGVIICPPIGYEQLHSHRSLRHLADSLAREKIPTLRFDWQCTGDSPGVDEDSRQYATWINNIHDSVEWMRHQLGCRHVSLIGLRIGATFAALATQNNEIDNLVLWSPVIKGRVYVREMKALGLTSDAPIRTDAPASTDIEAAGFTLNSETATELSSIDLLQIRPNCRRALVISRADLPEDDRLCHQWAMSGVRIEQVSSPGFVEMMAEPHRSEVPRAAIHQMTDWVKSAISSDAKSFVPNDEATRRSSISLVTPSMTSNATKTDARILESTFRISQRPNLFGVVSEPASFVGAALPMIVLLNAGCAYRIAPSRLNVLLARQLAAQGFRCLRMDLNGLGDSISESPEHENDSYSATVFRDIDIMLTQVEERFKTNRVVLTGLCSGAYAAFQSAAQIHNPAIVESILINPLTFFWKEGMSLDAPPTKDLMAFHYYKTVAFNPKKWWKLLSGQSKTGISGAVKILMQRLGLLKAPAAISSSKDSDFRQTSGVSHPQKEDLRGDLKRIARMNRHLAMFFSKSDPGFSILNYHARRKANKLQASGQLKIAFINDADHTFTRRAAKADLIKSIVAHLRSRYQ